MKLERKARKEKAASYVTWKDSEAPLGHRDPQERLVSRDSQGPKGTEACQAGMALKVFLVQKVHQG